MADEPNEPNKPNPAEHFQNLLAKNNNDALKLASQLFDENFTYRTTIRELTGKQPAEGAMVLQPDDAKEYKAFQQFKTEHKLDLKQIKEKIEKLPELEKANKSLSNTETIFKLSEIGLEGAKLKRNVLKEQVFDKYPEAVWSFKVEKDKDGKEAEVAYLSLDGKESSFTDFAKEKLADYLPSLKVSPEAQPYKPGNAGDPPPFRAATDTEADTKAQSAQASAVRRTF